MKKELVFFLCACVATALTSEVFAQMRDVDGAPMYYVDGSPLYSKLAAPTLQLNSGTKLKVLSSNFSLTRDKIVLRYRLRAAGDIRKMHFLFLMLDPVKGSLLGEKDFGGDTLANPLGLTATIDGAPFTFEPHGRATVFGIDVGQQLRAAGLPLSPLLPATTKAIKALPADVKAGLSKSATLVNGRANWDYAITYIGRPEIDPGKEVELVIIYHPVFYPLSESPLEMDGELVFGIDAESLDFLCIHDAQMAEIKKRFAERGSEEPPRPYQIFKIEMPFLSIDPLYNLTFSVDLPSPGDILTSCGGNFVRSGPKRYEWKRDWSSPTQDLWGMDNFKIYFWETVKSK